jgi:hypothetical protein
MPLASGLRKTTVSFEKISQILVARPNFLKGKDVRGGFFEPVAHAISKSGSYAVYVY